MKYTLLFFISILIFTACKNKDSYYKEISTKIALKKGTYTIEKNVLLFDTTHQELKLCMSPTAFINGEQCFAYIGLKDSMLSVFNITKDKVVQKYKLHFEEDKYDYVCAIGLVSLDSIFVQQFNRIALVNKDKIIKSWDVNIDSNSRNCINTEDQNPIYYDKNTHELILQQYCYVCDNDSQNYLETSPIIFLNITNNKMREPNIMYSKIYFDNYYGFLNKVYISNDEQNTYLSYAEDPNIYIVNRKTLEVKTVGGKCSYQKRDALPLDEKYRGNEFSEKKIQHITLSHFYDRIIVDNYKNLYYRFYLDDLLEKKIDGLFSKYSDKQIILMVFNKNWERIDEIPLGKINDITWFNYVTQNGLYIKNRNNTYTLIKINE